MAQGHSETQEAWQLKVPRAKTKVLHATLAHMLTFSFRTSALMYFYSFYFNAHMFPMAKQITTTFKDYNKFKNIAHHSFLIYNVLHAFVCS